MKDSGIPWLGQIPEQWKIEKVKRLFKLRKSKGNITPILLAATQNHGMYPQSKLDSVVQVAENTDLQNFKTVHVNDYVISLRSFQGGFEISEYEGVCSPAYQVFHSTVTLHHKYYKTLFKSMSFIDHINSLTVGIREGKNIQYETFSYSFLPVPPLPEQERIAEYLDGKCAEIDELISVEEQMIAELQAYKQSIITETVTKGLNPNAPLKDSGIPWLGQIPEHWQAMRNKDIFQESKEVVGEKASSYTLLSLTKQGVIVRDLTESKGKFPKEFDTYKKVTPNDMVFCLFDMDETPRTVGLSNHFGMITGAYDIFKVKRAFPRYVLYYFLSIDNQKAFRPFYKGLRKVVQMPTFLAIRIPLPPLPEQNAIAEYLDRKCEEIDALVEVKQRKIEELKEYKKSVIYEYVTGKREIV